MDQIDSVRVGEYASEDADYTWRLYEHFKGLMADAPVRSVFENVEMPLIEVLAEMEHNGAALDCDVLAAMSVSMAERLEELTGKPVVSANQATIWLVARQLGLEGPIDGFGSLLRDHLAMVPA